MLIGHNPMRGGAGSTRAGALSALRKSRIIAMKTTLAGLLALLFVAGTARTTLGQLPAGAKIQGIYTKDDQQRKIKEEERAVARVQAEMIEASRPRMEMWVPEAAPGYAQPAAYGYAQPAAYGYAQPAMYGHARPDGGVQPAGFHHHHAQAYGGACGPNGCGPYGYGHHGHHAGGGYGYFGGAHHTPGYPHLHHHFSCEYIGPQGPPTAAVAYPYYTTRGPRDFLMDNPPSIGR